MTFELVRHSDEARAAAHAICDRGGGLGFIITIAEITFYGRDQAGNEVSVTGMIDVQFGDFGDP